MRRLCALVPCLLPLAVSAVEIDGWVSVQWQGFAQEGLAGQSQSNLSIATQPEFYHDFENPWEMTVELFARYDQEDLERRHLDIREAHVLGIYDSWEFKVGISKEYWGATEFAHLVDVVNQTDAVENLDGEDKLGQPMLKATWFNDWGSVEVYLLPGFRERTFPGEDGRFIATPIPISGDDAEYESSAKEWHTDAALRFNGAFDGFDLGMALFVGTNRDPLIRSSSGKLVPYYEQMTQVSYDITVPVGGWLWKSEGRYRDTETDEFTALTGGFEYTFVGVSETPMDVGVLLEYIWDERQEDADTFLQNDIFIGARLAFNNMQETALLAGLVADLDDGGNLFNLELEHRINDSMRLEAQLRFFEDADAGDALYPFRDDDYIQVELFYYF